VATGREARRRAQAASGVSSTHSRAVELPRCHAGKARQLGHYENAGERERD
jgi:hypothetical protein